MRRRAERYCSAVEKDASLAKVQTADSQAAQLKDKAKQQAKAVCEDWLPQLDALEKEFALN